MYPNLVGFVNSNLTRLFVRKIWTMPIIWEGFVRYCDVRTISLLSILACGLISLSVSDAMLTRMMIPLMLV